MSLEEDTRLLHELLGADYASLLAVANDRLLRSGGDRKGLDDAELVALHAYTGDWYGTMNAALRGMLDETALEALAPMIRLAISALDKLPDVQGTFIRGVTLPDDELAAHVSGAVRKYPAFTSTSRLHGFDTPHQFFIDGRHGKDVSFLSAHPEEEEILFPPGTQFRVLERVESGGKIYLRMEEVQ